MQILIEVDGLAVDVHHSGFGSDNGCFIHLDDIDLGRLVHVFAQEIAANDGQFKGRWFADDAEVHLAIPKRSPWRNRHVVAHLVGVGKGDEESLGLDFAITQLDGVFLFAQGKVILDDVAEIGVEATMAVLGVVVGDLSVVTRTGDADERHAVHRDGVNLAYRFPVDQLQCLDGTKGDVEAAGEAIA